MGNDIYIAGIGMTRFTLHLDKSHHKLAAMATDEVLKDAGLEKDNIEAVFSPIRYGDILKNSIASGGRLPCGLTDSWAAPL